MATNTDQSLVECDCGARVAAVALVTSDHACPACGTRLHCCPNPDCFGWSAQLPWAAAGCPRCGIAASTIAALRTGRRTLRALREDPGVPVPRLDATEVRAR